MHTYRIDIQYRNVMYSDTTVPLTFPTITLPSTSGIRMSGPTTKAIFPLFVRYNSFAGLCLEVVLLLSPFGVGLK